VDRNRLRRVEHAIIAGIIEAESAALMVVDENGFGLSR
jgi:hypothetical protein